MNLLFAALVAKTIVPTVELPETYADPCISFSEPEAHSGSLRLIRTSDLVGLADIGRSDPYESPSPFGISPDGKRIAFVVRRANAAENQYCQQLMVMPIGGGNAPRELDRGGALIRNDFELRKFVSIMAGSAKVITPRWSPDGRSIAFLKQQGKTSQVWLVRGAGDKPASRATDMPDNVDDFAWTESGEALVVATRPGIRIQAEAIAREARSGFLFDERFAPDKADFPIPIEPVTYAYNTIELVTGKTRQSTPAEIAKLRPERPEGAPRNIRSSVNGAGGVAAWREPIHPSELLSPTGLTLKQADGRILKCEERCSGTKQLWWSVDGSSLYAIQKTGWGGSQTALLRWKLGAEAPRRIMITDDALVGCELAGKELICAREGALRPRRVVAINPDTGRERLIHNPNPAFGRIKLGTTQRFKFRSSYGVESYADLVLPPLHRAGAKHPLVVVQYHSEGFLRGSTGNEFPIQLLAAKGFAVLSFARPNFVPAAMAGKTELEIGKANRADWIDRRNVHSSLEMAVEQAINSGTIDSSRMGITGFSDGTATTQWALINSSLFKVAALGTCCEDMWAFPIAAGPTFTQYGREIGYRFFEPGVEDHWKPLSLLLNVDRINVPILIQSPDSEYEGSLDVLELYKHRGKAIELYVLAGEPHVKYQPAHRRATYERSTEWFQFWLMQRINCDPAKADQYARWMAMKDAPKAEELRCENGPSILP